MRSMVVVFDDFVVVWRGMDLEKLASDLAWTRASLVPARADRPFGVKGVG